MAQLQRSRRLRQENSEATEVLCLQQGRGRCNFSERWIVSANSVCMSNTKDHTQSDQHTHAMMPLKKEQGRAASLGDSSYAPIAQALYHCIAQALYHCIAQALYHCIVVSCAFSSQYCYDHTLKLFLEM